MERGCRGSIQPSARRSGRAGSDTIQGLRQFLNETPMMAYLVMLPVGQKHEYFIPAEEIRSGKTSPTVKVTYQDIFQNEFTIED